MNTHRRRDLKSELVIGDCLTVDLANVTVVHSSVRSVAALQG